MFYGTEIPTIIMILKKHRSEKDILFVDASKLYVKGDKKNEFTKSHVKKIADVVNHRIEIENFSRRVSLDEIVQNDYNLNISRYIDNFKKARTIWSLFNYVWRHKQGRISKAW